MGICEKPSPIQGHSIPIAPTNRDVFARAKKWHKQNCAICIELSKHLQLRVMVATGGTSIREDKSGDQTIIDETQKRFQHHNNGDLIDPNICKAVFVIVSRYGNGNTEEELRKQYRTADMIEEKVRIFCSMGESLKLILI